MRALLALSVAGIALAGPSGARAQTPELASVRASLATYELDGDRTIAALRDLQAALARPTSAPAALEARFLRAAVATDLLVAGSIDPAYAPLEARVASALGIAPEALAAHLRDELAAVQHGVYRGPARTALSALALRDALARGDASSIAWGRHRGPRRDLLLLRAAGEAIVPSMAEDPCAGGACAAPYAALDPSSRRALAALVEAGAALARVERAAASGDPLAASLLSHVRPAAARIAGSVVRPAPSVPASIPVQACAATGEALRPALLIAIAGDAVHVTRPASYAVRDGRAVVVEGGDDVLPAAVVVALPRELRPVVTAIDELVDAIRAREPAEGPIAIAAAPDVPAHVVARVALSAQRAGRAPTLLVRRAPDGTLRGAPIVLADSGDVGVPGDIVVRVRLGGYGLARGRGPEQSIPRLRGEGGLAFDLAALGASIERIPHRRVVLDAMASVRAADLFDAAFRIGRPDDPVLLTN